MQAKRLKYTPGMILGCYRLLEWSHKTSGTNMWHMECTICGAKHIHSPAQIKQEPRKACSSCATPHKTHGLTRSPTYISWCRMWQRVRGTDPHANTYQDVTVDPACASFENFLADMGERPKGTTLDRIDSFGNYCKENCRWTDTKTQNRNTRRARMWTIGGETLHIMDWAERWGISDNRAETLWAAIKRERN